ncbi:large neutral amino acids transporter small subunit 1 isoform X3 [Patella vulgata]|nr:large neutral amino acids transporter small subunit 1 isoform X3 [Patella vulgata]
MELTGDEEITVTKVKLKRSINFASTTSILLTNIGGSAIFISPSAILHYSGSPIVALILWLISGILNAGLAFCFVEIGLLFPKAGGPYFYILEVFGSLYGFIFLWGFVSLIFASSWAISSYSAAIYLVTAVSPSCPYPDLAVKILAGWIIVTLVVLNCTYMKLVTKIQGILSMAKILALLLIIVTGLLQLSNSEKNNLVTLINIEDRSIDVGSLALGLFAGFFNYGG